MNLGDLKWIDRYGPFIAGVNIGMALVSLHFAIVVLQGGSPVTPELYGPAVYAIPALSWAAVQFVTHSIATLGAVFRKPWLLIAGGAGGAAVHGSFSALAGLAEHGTLLQAGTLYLTVPLSVATVLAGAGGLRNA